MGILVEAREAYLRRCGEMDVSSHLRGMQIEKRRDVRGMKCGTVTLRFDSVEAGDGFWVKTRDQGSRALAELARFSLILPCDDKREILVVTAIRGKFAYDPAENNPADVGVLHAAHRQHYLEETTKNEGLVKELNGSSALDRICTILKDYFGSSQLFKGVPS